MNVGDLKNPVYAVSLLLCVGIAAWAILFNESFDAVSNFIFTFLSTNFGWLYLIAMLAFVVFVLVLACTKWGRVKLGPDNSQPDYSTMSWFAMLFCCGMGVGLVFWGVAEPISHYVSPMSGIEPSSPESASFAMAASFMHWGVHPWANYAIIGLALAYFIYRKKKPALISSALSPILEKRLGGKWLAGLVDILALFATMAGVVTSLGLGVLQINAGLNYMFSVPFELGTQIIIILVISALFIISAILGIDRGIKVVSDINLAVAMGMLVMCFVMGPKVEVLNTFVGGMGEYLGTFLQSSLGISAYGDNAWILAWRIFYWAWWIAWAPFVGIFIARISRGRTIREFIFGVVFVPALASILWFAVFGNLGLSLAEAGALSPQELADVAASPETGLFLVLNHYPFGTVLSIVMIVLICTFFITSADSGTFVLSMLSSEGSLRPSNVKKAIWGIVLTAMAIGLLLAGGLKPLQTMSIAAAFPFIFVMFGAMIALVKEFAGGGKDDSEVDQE